MNWKKCVFRWEKWNFELIANSESLALGKVLFISTICCFAQAGNMLNETNYKYKFTLQGAKFM